MPTMPKIPLKGAVRVVVIIASVLLILLIASLLFAGQFVASTINYVVAILATRSGISVFLVRAIVIIGTIPFFWAVAQFTRSIFGLLGLGWNPLALYKNKYGMIIVAYIGVFYGALYWASAHSYFYKYCAETPEGISLSDSPGRDPVYGREFKPCTEAQTEEMRHKDGDLAAPKEIRIANAANYEWFDVAGRARVWYAVESDGSYRYFDHSGVDPSSGHTLQPVNEAVIQQLKRQQAADNAKRHEVDERQASEEAKAKNAAEAQELVTQAQGEFDAANYKAAMETCDHVLSKSRTNAECVTIRQHAAVKLAQQLVDKGESELEKGQLDEAMWNADTAMRLDPTNRSAAKLKILAAQLKPRTSN